MECKFLIRSLKDSAADSKLKLLKEGETYGVEKPGGEKRIHIGATTQESEYDSFFFPNGGKKVTVTVFKIDLIRYMLEAKDEYYNPRQHYRLPISEYYEERYQQTLGIQDDSFQICFEKNIDSKRYYLTRPSGDVLSRNYNYIINICLPLITNYVFLRVGNNGGPWSFFLKPEFVTPERNANNQSLLTNEKTPLQQIFYGAPGTGKSHEIKEKTKGECVIRTTFHPDSDYSTFVGAYKPTMDDVDAKVVPVVLGESGTVFNKNEGTYKEKRIVYQFVMQAFLKAYLGAWKKFAEASGDEVKPQFLVIEEINRGNCAQIIGDLFQLLDRGKSGFSEYPIEADNDLQQEIERAFKEHKDYKLKEGVKINAEGVVEDYTSNYEATLSEDIQSGRVLLLPSNLYIWATMNTSDQSLFPIDSAFKRRWDWKYLPIENAAKGWKIKVNGNEYDWYQFLEAINKEVFTLTHSEDKQLGYFFAKAKDGVIDAETLVNKVYFYLWTDVFKDYDYESQKAFRKSNSNDPIAFKNFFEDLKDGEKVNEEMAEQVLINLEIEKLNKPQDLFE